MKKLTKTYDLFEVVLVPFPFTDSAEVKKRPAIVLSSRSFNQQSSASVMAMITSATHSPWPDDVHIRDLSAAGLPVESIIRMKLFTLDQRLIIRNLGVLSKSDQGSLIKSLKAVLDL
jgi:mRNA interferase MazF